MYCPFVKDCWNSVGILIDDSIDPIQIFDSFRDQLSVPFFMEVIIIMSWSIWTVRKRAVIDVWAFSRKIFGLLLWRAKKYFP